MARLPISLLSVSLALLFVSAMVRFEKERFSYGYKWHLERMRRTTIKLPVLEDGSPHWQNMKRYMLGLPFSAALSDQPVT